METIIDKLSGSIASEDFDGIVDVKELLITLFINYVRTEDFLSLNHEARNRMIDKIENTNRLINRIISTMINTDQNRSIQ